MRSFLILVLFAACVPQRTFDGSPRPWVNTITVSGYGAATETAVRLWNQQVGCPLFVFVRGPADVTVREADGEPCGKIWGMPATARDTAAQYYQCSVTRADILVSHPGDIWQQTWIVHHELGHVLGLAHDRTGLMGRTVPDDGPTIRARWADAMAVRDRYCGR